MAFNLSKFLSLTSALRPLTSEFWAVVRFRLWGASFLFSMVGFTRIYPDKSGYTRINFPVPPPGSTAAPAVVRRALAPNTCAPENTKRRVNATPPSGARGRVPRHPGRARSPIQRQGYGLDLGLAHPPRHHGAKFGVCPALRDEVSPPLPAPCFLRIFHFSFFILHSSFSHRGMDIDGPWQKILKISFVDNQPLAPGSYPRWGGPAGLP